MCSCFTALGWLPFSICLFLSEVVSAHWMSTSVQCCFSSCHTIASQRIWILWASSHSSCDIQTSSSRRVRSFRLPPFFLCHDEKEKKVQYLNPLSLSHVQASICMSQSHVLIPFCSGCCHGVFPAASGVFLAPTERHNLHRTELYGSRLTFVIWRFYRPFISAAETPSRCGLSDIHSAWDQPPSNWEGKYFKYRAIAQKKNMGGYNITWL